MWYSKFGIKIHFFFQIRCLCEITHSQIAFLYLNEATGISRQTDEVGECSPLKELSVFFIFCSILGCEIVHYCFDYAIVRMNYVFASSVCADLCRLVESGTLVGAATRQLNVTFWHYRDLLLVQPFFSISRFGDDFLNTGFRTKGRIYLRALMSFAL